MKKGFLISALALVGLMLCGCQKQNMRNGEKYGGTLRMNINDIPRTIFPGQIEKRSEQIIVTQVFDGLVRYNPRTLNIIPSLAKSFSVSPDGLTYSFLLNNNAYFHNDICFANGKGRRIVSKDVKYSIEQICRHKMASGYSISRQIENIVGSDNFIATAKNNDTVNIYGIKTISDSILTISLKKPDELFLHYLASVNALVFAPEAYNTYGINGTVGSGAYYLQYSKQPSKTVTLTYNPNYYRHLHNDQLPYIDTIQFSFVVSGQKELYLLERGSINVVFDLPNTALTKFLEKNIDLVQSASPKFIVSPIINPISDKRFNIITSDIASLYINSQNYFDFAIAYFRDPVRNSIVLDK